MSRVARPRPGEPIKIVITKSGHRYRAVVDFSAKGAPRKQLRRTFDTLTEARAFIAETRHQVKTQRVHMTGETVEELCTRWLAGRVDIRPVTREHYQHMLAPVVSRLGSASVQELTVADVDALVRVLSSEGGRRGQRLGPRAVKGALGALAQALDLALREDSIARNVVRLARKPRIRRTVGTDLEHWQPEQIQRFVETADHDRLAGAWRLTCSGMTRADVLGMRWSDIDLTAGVVTVSQGRVALDHGHVVDDPKSTARRRAIPVEQIWPGTMDKLRAMRAQQAADRLRLGGQHPDPPTLVVLDVLGSPVRPEWYSDHFRQLSAEAGVPVIKLHSVRHSLAFWLHREGVAPADAAALLGHTVEVHLSTYLPHSGTAGIASAAQALGRSRKALPGGPLVTKA
jgi:integrase